MIDQKMPEKNICAEKMYDAKCDAAFEQKLAVDESLPHISRTDRSRKMVCMEEKKEPAKV